LEIWRTRSDYRLYEAALLIVGRSPADWTVEKLLSAPPSDFAMIYGQMLIGAEVIKEKNVESQEYTGVFYDVYEFMTHQFQEFHRLTNRDKLLAVVERSELIRWLKTKKNFPDNLFLNPELTTSPVEKTPSYSTPWLKILEATAAQFFNPRQTYDAKRDEVVDWVKAEAKKAGLPDSSNIATAIFTIIKPIDHDPKKKRV
jgi:hypothetical protein